ncbi:hypothetical protein [Capnocytophaga canimorsus]|uniref:hypothetical protein n=1 Tax=Capnocytophaga canimorsus TaxID=28188 RepID=UPI0015628543|nr:hypothetical protein [Capnocytophaga canimorsus]
MRIKKIFNFDDKTIFVVDKVELSFELNWEIHLNGSFYKKLPNLNRVILLKQSKNSTEMPVETTLLLEELRYLDLENNILELKS